MDVMDDGVRQPVAPKGIPNNFISRGMRGQRQYDVPQIGKCNSFFSLSSFASFLKIIF